MDKGNFEQSGFPRQAPPRGEDVAVWFGKVRDATILVVGDYFLDRYWLIDRGLAEDSIETGLEAHQVVGRQLSPGAAGTVANNVVALGCANVMAVGFTGTDGEGADLRREMRLRGMDTRFLTEWEGVVTPTYTKPMLREDGLEYRELSRLDIQNRVCLPEGLREELRAGLRAAWAYADGVLVSDQVEREGCGFWDEEMRALLAELAAADPQKPVLVDSRANIGRFEGVMLKPNEHEAAGMLGMGALGADPGAIASALSAYRRGRDGNAWFVTLGACGMLVFDGAGSNVWLPGIEVTGPIDIVGAGDSTAAGIMVALVGGAGLAEAGWVGQATASLTIQQIGTTGTAQPEDVTARLERLSE